MSKRVWIVLGVLFGLFVVGAAAAVGGYFYLKEQRIQANYREAEKWYGEGEWGMAKVRYAAYLSRYNDDVDVLRKYAKASEKILKNRRQTLGDAASAYNQIATLEPENLEVAETIVELQKRRRAWGDLEYYAAHFGERWPQNEKLAYYQAFALQRMGRHDDAMEAYQSLAAAGTEYAEVYKGLAELTLERGTYSQAMNVFETALEDDPENPDILLEQARFQLAEGKTEAAWAAYEKAKALAPDALETKLVGANLHAARDEYEQSAALAEAVIEADPENREAYLAATSAYEATEQYEKAIEVLQRAEPAMMADNPEFYIALGELYVGTDQLEQARENLKEYQTVYPDHGTMSTYLESRILMAEGNSAQAATKLTAVVDSAPDFRQGQFYLAAALLQSRKRDQAKAAFEVYLSNYPSDKQAREIYQREFGRSRRVENVERMAESQLTSSASEPRALVATAAALFNRKAQADEMESAAPTVKRLLEQAIQADPDYAFSYRVLIEVMLSMGDPAGAETVLTRAKAAGVPESELHQVEAQIALADGRMEEAHSLFASVDQDNQQTVNEVIRWAEVFTLRGSLEDGLRVLRTAANRREAADADTLQLERVSLAGRFGNTELALELLDELESQPEPSETTVEGIRTQKIDLVRTMMGPGENQDMAAAKTLVEELLNRYPNNTRIKLLKAEVLWNQDPPDFEAANDVAQSVLEANPNNSEVMLTLASLAAREGDDPQAIEYAERAESASPNSVEPYAFLAETYLRMRNTIRALSALDRGLAIHPEDPRLLEMYVEANRLAGQLGQAEAAYRRLENVTNNTPEAARRLGVLRAKLLLEQNERPEVVESLLRAQLDEQPNDVRTALDLAKLLVQDGRREEANRFMEQFAERNSDRPQSWVALGRYYLDLGAQADRPKATKALTRALLLDRDFAPALLTLIEVNLRMNNLTDALTFCDRYLENHPGDDTVLFQKARILSQQSERLPEALKTLNRALQIQKKNEYFLLRGLVKLELDQAASALEDLQQVSRNQLEQPGELDLALAQAYAMQGDRDLAQRHLSTAESQMADGAALNRRRLERVRSIVGELETSEG